VFVDQVQLPKIGRVELKEKGYILQAGANILSATVSERAGRWFVSVQAKVEIQAKPQAKHTIGIDLGVKERAVCSNGEIFVNHQLLKKKEKLLRVRLCPFGRNETIVDELGIFVNNC